MVTILRAGGFRFSIYKDDHEPSHVHVNGDGEAKINLVGPGGRPDVVWSIGFSKGDLRYALGIVTERQSEFLERWRGFHG